MKACFTSLLVFSCALTASSAGAKPAQFVAHVDHATVRAGGAIEVSVENRGAPVVVNYSGGSNGCAIPRFEAQLIDANGSFISIHGPRMCTMAIVPPGSFTIPGHATQNIARIDTNAVYGFIGGTPQKLAPGRYTLNVSMSGVSVTPITIVVLP